MKNIVFIALCLFSFILVSCGKDEVETPNSGTSYSGSYNGETLEFFQNGSRVKDAKVSVSTTTIDKNNMSTTFCVKSASNREANMLFVCKQKSQGDKWVKTNSNSMGPSGSYYSFTFSFEGRKLILKCNKI